MTDSSSTLEGELYCGKLIWEILLLVLPPGRCYMVDSVQLTTLIARSRLHMDQLKKVQL